MLYSSILKIKTFWASVGFSFLEHSQTIFLLHDSFVLDSEDLLANTRKSLRGFVSVREGVGLLLAGLSIMPMVLERGRNILRAQIVSETTANPSRRRLDADFMTAY